MIPLLTPPCSPLLLQKGRRFLQAMKSHSFFPRVKTMRTRTDRTARRLSRHRSLSAMMNLHRRRFRHRVPHRPRLPHLFLPPSRRRNQRLFPQPSRHPSLSPAAVRSRSSRHSSQTEQRPMSSPTTEQKGAHGISFPTMTPLPTPTTTRAWPRITAIPRTRRHSSCLKDGSKNQLKKNSGRGSFFIRRKA